MSGETAGAPILVRHFRTILLWPLQLAPTRDDAPPRTPWSLLRAGEDAHPWRPIENDFTADPTRFPECRYAEFVTFLPYVQRVLYGEGVHGSSEAERSPIRIFGRDDVARVRVVLQAGGAPLQLEVQRVRLFLFADIDVVIPVVELRADDLSLPTVQDLLLRFGRAYPATWEASGEPHRCPASVEWLSGSGEVLAASDYQDRAHYLASVAQNRAPCIATHWEWLLRPLLPDYSPEGGPLRFRQLEYYRMPLMAYLAFDDPTRLTRADFVSLGLVAGPTDGGSLPLSERALETFEHRYCYDHHWAPNETHRWTNTRVICSGHAFLMIGRQDDRFFADRETGLLGQFRRVYFLLGLLAHFHKAALLMLSDRLVVAINRLEVGDVESVKRFKREIRQALQTFLRFTHRYWFHEVSIQDQGQDLFRMWSRHLGTDRLYAEVREEIQDMSEYLNSDSLRRQANTVVRLTVVTTLGLIGTVVTGILGMNLFAHADEPWPTKVGYFVLAMIPSVLVILYAVVRSKALADFLEILSDDRASWGNRLGALRRAVW